MRRLKSVYNSTVSIYLNPRNTQETKTHIKRILISLEDYIWGIINGLSEIIGRLKASRSINLDSVMRAYTLYEIILTQFNKGIFYKISDETINHDLAINIKKHNPGFTAQDTQNTARRVKIKKSITRVFQYWRC